MDRYVVALTGASGVIYGLRLVEELMKQDFEVHLIVSQPASLVIEQELKWNMNNPEQAFKSRLGERIIYHDNSDISAPLASGSFICRAMIIAPCTMATVSAVACGASRSLLERTADVMIKEKRPLIVVPRETPLSSIHLSNLLRLADLGVHVIPAMPAFYIEPQTVDDLVSFIVGKIMDALRLEHQLFKPYQ